MEYTKKTMMKILMILLNSNSRSLVAEELPMLNQTTDLLALLQAKDIPKEAVLATWDTKQWAISRLEV